MQDLVCVEDVIASVGQPDILIMRKEDGKLADHLNGSSRWSVMAEIGGYMLWLPR